MSFLLFPRVSTDKVNQNKLSQYRRTGSSLCHIFLSSPSLSTSYRSNGVTFLRYARWEYFNASAFCNLGTALYQIPNQNGSYHLLTLHRCLVHLTDIYDWLMGNISRDSSGCRWYLEIVGTLISESIYVQKWSDTVWQGEGGGEWEGIKSDIVAGSCGIKQVACCPHDLCGLAPMFRW